MSNLAVTIIGGIVVAILVSLLGIGKINNQVIITHGFKVKKTGKWIMIIASIMIIWGFMLMGNNADPTASINPSNRQTGYGFLLIFYGIIIFLVGKIVAWFQKL